MSFKFFYSMFAMFFVAKVVYAFNGYPVGTGQAIGEAFVTIGMMIVFTGIIHAVTRLYQAAHK